MQRLEKGEYAIIGILIFFYGAAAIGVLIASNVLLGGVPESRREAAFVLVFGGTLMGTLCLLTATNIVQYIRAKL